MGALQTAAHASMIAVSDIELDRGVIQLPSWIRCCTIMKDLETPENPLAIGSRRKHTPPTAMVSGWRMDSLHRI
jgi:hypothetical protein